LHDLLLRAAHFEVGRRRSAVARLSTGDVDDLANQAADDALVAVLRKLDTYRGASRFTTWAYKFALYEAAVSVRRRSWQNREIPLEAESWSLIAEEQGGPVAEVETGELLDAVRDGIGSVLTSHQREVLVALAINGVPIDVLAERLTTTRGALYKTLHDARRKLRAELSGRGFALGGEGMAR
jgi:RNA polymerase sigma-70 factor (ECF subfamily)